MHYQSDVDYEFQLHVSRIEIVFSYYQKHIQHLYGMIQSTLTRDAVSARIHAHKDSCSTAMHGILRHILRILLGYSRRRANYLRKNLLRELNFSKIPLQRLFSPSLSISTNSISSYVTLFFRSIMCLSKRTTVLSLRPPQNDLVHA